MSKRTLTVLECHKLIDNLQAVHHNIDDACKRLGMAEAQDFGQAFENVGKIVPYVNGVIVKLMEQSQELFTPVTDTQVVDGGIVPPKYRNDSAEFELTDDEWAVADQWKGVYQNVDHSWYDHMIVED